MTKQMQHDYLMTLLKELEKEGNQIKLDNFVRVMEDLLQFKYRVRNYFDFPISAAQYDELISYAETLLDVDTSGRTKHTSGVQGAMSDVVLDALVDQALVNMEFVDHILRNYTPDQLTIDIVKQAADNGSIIDGVKVNRQTADQIAAKIKKIQNSNGLNTDQWVAFTAKKDIKKGDFVLIDEHDNQVVTAAKDMELSELDWEGLKKELDSIKVETTNAELEKRMNDFFDLSDKVMTEYKEAYAALGKGHRYGAMYSLDEVRAALDKAPKEVKMVWYFEPFQQFFVGNITGMNDFPFIYKNEDPSHDDYTKNTPVVGPFNGVKELEDYFDLMVHEESGMYDSDFVKHLRGLVVMIKHYESKDDAHNYSTIIDKLWENLKSFLLGNI
jgi:hypothetical protein